MTIRWVLTVLTLTVSHTAVAEPELAIAPGDLVRVQSSALENRTIGTVVSRDERSLTVSLERRGVLTQIPVTTIHKIEVSRGRRSAAGKGALIGAGAGAVATFAFFRFSCGDCYQEEGWWSDVTPYVAGGALVGTGVGALLGHVIGADRWARADRRSLLLQAVPVRKGAMLSAIVRF